MQTTARPARRIRSAAVLAAAALGVAVWSAPPAQAAPVPVPVTPKAGISFNGTVFAVAMAADVVYAGGDFTSVTGTNGTFARTRLAAINLTTGAVTSFRADANARVRALALSGTSVFVGRRLHDHRRLLARAPRRGQRHHRCGGLLPSRCLVGGACARHDRRPALRGRPVHLHRRRVPAAASRPSTSRRAPSTRRSGRCSTTPCSRWPPRRTARPCTSAASSSTSTTRRVATWWGSTRAGVPTATTFALQHRLPRARARHQRQRHARLRRHRRRRQPGRVVQHDQRHEVLARLRRRRRPGGDVLRRQRLLRVPRGLPARHHRQAAGRGRDQGNRRAGVGARRSTPSTACGRSRRTTAASSPAASSPA